MYVHLSKILFITAFYYFVRFMKYIVKLGKNRIKVVKGGKEG